MKKFFAICLAMAMMLSMFAGCGTKSSTDNPGTSDKPSTDVGAVDTEKLTQTAWEDSIIRVAIDLDPGTLGPYETNNNGRKATLYEVYESLAAYQARGGEVKGVLAKNWYEESDNVYIIELYDYITDSAGNQITADDVIFSFETGMSQFKRYLKYIDSAEKVDDYTVRVTLNSADVGTLEHILCHVWIIDQESYEGSPDAMATTPIGTGPYVVTKHVEGSKLIMEAREDYWQKEELRVNYQHQNVKTIEFLVIAESAQKTIALETGTVDVVAKMSYSGAAGLLDNENFNVDTSLSSDCYVLFFNCNESSVCNDLSLRQAINYAIDAQGVLDGVLDGYGEAAYAFGSSVYPDIDPDWNDGSNYAYNPDKAKEILKDAGYKDGTTVRLLTSSGEMYGKIATIVQGYLTQVGINVEIMQYESTLVKTYSRDFTSFDLYLAAGGSPDYAVINWSEKFSSTMYEDGLNYCGFGDAELDELLATALNKNTHNEQTMGELHEYIVENSICCPILSPTLFAVSNKSVLDVVGDHNDWMLPGCNVYVWN